MKDVEEFAQDVYKGAGVLEKEVEGILEDVAGSSSSTYDTITGSSDIYEDIIGGSTSDYPTKEMQDDWDSIGLSDDVILSVQGDQAGLYYYEQLDDDEQELYAQILYILSNQAEEIYITTTDMDVVEKVQQCVLNDHPEIFYVEGYLMKRFMSSENDEVKALTYGGKYTLSSEEIADRMSRLEAAASSIIEGMPSTTDEYEIVKYFYDYIILNTEYEVGSVDNQNICSVLLNKKSVCQGYAKTLQYLLQKVGIICEMVSGTVNNTQTTSSHAWNLVKVNGSWYYVDPTWGDASFTGSVPGDTEVVNYAYLCVTTEDLSVTHKINEVVKMPECTSTSDNYFVRQNALFDVLDYAKLSNLFENAISSGSSFVTFKCSDSEVYNEMKNYLFSDNGGGIFEYLPSDATRAVYLSQDTTMTFIIWL